MCTADFQTHCFQNVCNTVPNCWSWCERKVYNAEFYAEHFRSPLTNQLTHSSNLECSLFNDVCQFVDGSIRILRNGRANNTRARNANIDDTIRFADTVECTCHERIIFRCVTEYNQLRWANTLPVSSQLGRFQNDFAHHLYSIHVNPALSRTNIDR